MDSSVTIDTCRRPIKPEEEGQLLALGAELRQLRSLVPLRHIAAVSGVSASTISRLERGKRRPRRSTLAALATTYRSGDAQRVWAHLVELAGSAIAEESTWRTHRRAPPTGFTDNDMGIEPQMGYEGL